VSGQNCTEASRCRQASGSFYSFEQIQSIKGSKGSMEKKPPQSGAEIYMEVVTAAAGNLS